VPGIWTRPLSSIASHQYCWPIDRVFRIHLSSVATRTHGTSDSFPRATMSFILIVGSSNRLKRSCSTWQPRPPPRNEKTVLIPTTSTAHTPRFVTIGALGHRPNYNARRHSAWLFHSVGRHGPGACSLSMWLVISRRVCILSLCLSAACSLSPLFCLCPLSP